jgi:hypothetical protein
MTRFLRLLSIGNLTATTDRSILKSAFSWVGAPVTTPREFFDTFLPRSIVGVEGTLPEDVVVAFHIDGPDGGAWQVARDPEGSRVGPVVEGPKDCEMWCSADTFMRIVRGSLGSNRAFLSGRLRIAGDIGLAMALETFLRDAA